MRLSLQRYAELNEEIEIFQVSALDHVSAPEQRLKTLRTATNEDQALVIIREYAETVWPDNKQRIPEPARPYSVLDQQGRSSRSRRASLLQQQGNCAEIETGRDNAPPSRGTRWSREDECKIQQRNVLAKYVCRYQTVFHVLQNMQNTPNAEPEDAPSEP